MKLTLSLIGRPNVGKSTLFNRLAGRRMSLVHDEPGLTRDRIYADAQILEREFLVIDTGGIEPDSDTALMHSIKNQAQVAMHESDVILFLVDAHDGLVAGDQQIAQYLRNTRKPVWVLVNKAEKQIHQASASEFYALGFEHVFSISAAHGQGIEALFEALIQQFPDIDHVSNSEQNEENSALKIAIVGKPNVGKSSFVNKLLGQERLLVSPEPGTTLDAVDEKIRYLGKEFVLIDTAGIRRKRSISKDTEKMAVSASLGALDRAQVALFLIDALEGVTEQDLKIASFIDKKSKGVVIVVNKWDLAKENSLKAEEFALHLREKMPFMAHAPVRFVSALSGLRVFDVLETAEKVLEAYQKRVSTSQVNRMLERAVAAHQPPMVRGRRLKFFYGTQVSVAPPIFLFTVNEKNGIHFSYERYLSNRIREEFSFKGSPIRMIFRDRSSKGD